MERLHDLAFGGGGGGGGGSGGSGGAGGGGEEGADGFGGGFEARHWHMLARLLAALSLLAPPAALLSGQQLLCVPGAGREAGGMHGAPHYRPADVQLPWLGGADFVEEVLWAVLGRVSRPFPRRCVPTSIGRVGAVRGVLCLAKRQGLRVWGCMALGCLLHLGR